MLQRLAEIAAKKTTLPVDVFGQGFVSLAMSSMMNHIFTLAFEFDSNCKALGCLAVRIKFKCFVSAPFSVEPKRNERSGEPARGA